MAKANAQPDHTGERWVEYMRVRDLVPAPRNPNLHDSEAIGGAITRHGFIDPPTLDERTQQMVAGHGRRDDLLRREAAGEAPPEGIKLDTDGAYLAPVLRGWSSTSDEEAEAALVALNIAAEWDDAGLAEVLADLAATPLGLTGTGYTDATLDDLLARLGDEEVLAPQPTDADYAEQTERGEAQAPREVQGLHEVGLMFQADAHRQYLEHLARLRNAWGEDVPALVVLRAMAAAVEGLDG